MSYSLREIEALGVDLQTGIAYTGGEDKYLSALQRFYKSAERNMERMKSSLERNDLEDLAITVHALKSNAKMIGAGALSALFETLELASRKKDMHVIRANMGQALDEYRRLLQGLKPLGERTVYRAPGELSPEEAREVAEKLLLALEDYDDDLAGDLAEKLMGYPFRITQRERLKEARELIREFLYEEAEAIIREIIPNIE